MKPSALTRRDLFSRTAAFAGTLSVFKNMQAAPPTSSTGEAAAACHICITCGTQFAETPAEPKECPVCEDDRQYVGAGGQQWTTQEKLRSGAWKNVVRELEPGIHSITTEPKFGIGQRALLIQTPKGNILWDCISLLDEATIRAVRDLGGVSAMAISHPHYYTTMVEWSRAFGDVPIHLHQDDARWVMRPDPRIHHWTGETKVLSEGFTLVRTAGHFDGYQVLHWNAGANKQGILFSGDQPQIAADPRWVSFMYSYPNMVPLNEAAIRRILTSLDPFEYERIYSAFTPGLVSRDAKAVVRRSAERYIRHILPS